ncbi:MAG: hypothetical protein K0R38_6227 [Polyangiaceae bacterium]|jgi:choline dehydrogenase-like flavoprotein|nr:hypothetical protein [Polyangiaceae bacterium]
MPLNKLVDSGTPAKDRPDAPDVQNTTFAVDGVSRFVCNTWEEVLAARGSQDFDVVIVGSGMYGGYLAAKLFELGEKLGNGAVRPRILVLESGPFLITQHIQNLPRLGGLDGLVQRPLVAAERVGPPGQGRFFVPHHRCVGGKSLFWGGWTPRLQEADFQKDWPKEVVDYLNSPAPAGSLPTDGYLAVERENGTWPVADFINGSLFEILRARASEVLSAVSKPLSLNSVPALAPATKLAWDDFKQNARADTWNTLTAEAKNEALASLEAIGRALDAAPTYSPLNPPIGVLGASPGSGLFAMDKFSSLPLLIESIRSAKDSSNGNDQNARLFLLPNAEVVRLETTEGRARQLVIALRSPSAPEETRQARVVRLDLKPGALVVLAANAINSTRLALNSFPLPAPLAPGGELIGRNLMAHVRGNFFWRIDRAALNVPPSFSRSTELQTAALHVRGEMKTSTGKMGQFHFQFYATPNTSDLADSPEQFLYQMVPNLEDLQDIIESQQAGKIVVGIRNTGETFGDRDAPIGTPGVGWVGAKSFGDPDDDVYFENGQELRVPKVYVNLVETQEDAEVREAQNDAAFEFVAALAGTSVADARDQSGTKPVQYLEFRSNGSRLSGDDATGTTYHESGTMWIGEDPSRSVTDVNGRFHHVSNAYCTDQSIFPSVGSANPVNTGLALTRMVARSILERFESTAEEALEPDFELLYEGDFIADGWQFAGAKFDGIVPFFDRPGGAPRVVGAGLDNPGFDSVLGVLWYTKKAYRDFVLKLDWRTFDARANSGIFIRTPTPLTLDDANYYNSATEIQIDERGFKFAPPDSVYGSSLHKTGAVYGVFPARQWAARVVGPRGTPLAGLWNRYVIEARGPSIKVALNGKLVSAGTLQNLQPAGSSDQVNGDPTRKRAEGFIGLQSHTEVAQFRNIRIKEL